MCQRTDLFQTTLHWLHLFHQLSSPKLFFCCEISCKEKFYYKNNYFYQSLLLKSLEIRLFYRKLNSGEWENSLSLFHRNSVKYSNDQRGTLNRNWLIFYLKFHGERNTGLQTITAAKLQRTKQTLPTSKHSIEFTSSDFPCHLVSKDKLALINCRWKCKKGKRLTIVARFRSGP